MKARMMVLAVAAAFAELAGAQALPTGGTVTQGSATIDTTGSSMQAAVLALRAARPARVVVAVPVASPEACEALGVEADDVVCLTTPKSFRAVGEWYEDFRQTSDEEVLELLALARGNEGAAGTGAARAAGSRA